MHAGEEHMQRVVPNGLFELIFYLEDIPESSDQQKSISDQIIITGQLKNFHDLKITGKISLFAIYFHPHGLSMFLDLPMKELFNHSVPLKYILKGRVSQLEDELLEASSIQEKITISERFLMAQIHKNEKKYQYDRIRNVVNQINQSKGIVKIEDLADASFLSRKQFERTFVDFIGTTPKQFLKIVRFQNAIHEKSKNPQLSLTELALHCGYFDQAHMINDFKMLSGITPKNYFKNPGYISDYFL
jgi:AraC-like DNA-binding protein